MCLVPPNGKFALDMKLKNRSISLIKTLFSENKIDLSKTSRFFATLDILFSLFVDEL